MGSGFSTIFSDINDKAPATSSSLCLGDLPENCLAMVLEHFDPPEICNLALVNQAFHRASSADLLWASKLPENYGVLIKKLLLLHEDDSKKDIYSRLCYPIRISSGTKEIWNEKRRGGICMLVSWRGMKITGISDRRYWTHVSTHQSRFNTIAYLKQIWWLEVEGDVDFDFPTGNYSVYFRLYLGKPTARQIQHNPSNNHQVQVHGWAINPVCFKFQVSNGENVMSKHFLNEQGKWKCYHVGDFLVHNSHEPTKIKFSMTQIDCTHQKGGLSLDSVLICPKGIKTHDLLR